MEKTENPSKKPKPRLIRLPEVLSRQDTGEHPFIEKWMKELSLNV
mgnify:CR=1 FL=1